MMTVQIVFVGVAIAAFPLFALVVWLTSSELDALDVALGVAVEDGRISAEDATSYLRLAFECHERGVQRPSFTPSC